VNRLYFGDTFEWLRDRRDSLSIKACDLPLGNAQPNGIEAAALARRFV
jgi:hypothetical protein